MSTTSETPGLSAGAADGFAVGDRRIVSDGSREIGVFRLAEGFVAYENVCRHQGGPVCSGRLFPRLRTRVAEDGRVLGERYDTSEPHLVCPWHGWEYDLRTGEASVGHAPGVRLRAFPVEVRDGEVIVDVT